MISGIETRDENRRKIQLVDRPARSRKYGVGGISRRSTPDEDPRREFKLKAKLWGIRSTNRHRSATFLGGVVFVSDRTVNESPHGGFPGWTDPIVGRAVFLWPSAIKYFAPPIFLSVVAQARKVKMVWEASDGSEDRQREGFDYPRRRRPRMGM